MAWPKARRPLRNTVGPVTAPYRTTIFNVNNAARNLVEFIANEARSDTAGDYPIRIYTIGMGELVSFSSGRGRRCRRTYSSE